MPIAELYSDYFQKSKTFLLPLLGIRRSPQTADIMTFIEWPGRYTKNDCRLIVCKSGGLDDPEFRKFEKIFLMANVYYETIDWVDSKTLAYVFNLEKHRGDWELFLQGKYSQLSITLKERIKGYYGEKTVEWELIRSFLYPDSHFERYAELLYDEKDRELGLQQLKAVGELCEPYNPELETLKFSETVLEKSL